MRTLLFFDLPSVTNQDLKNYRKFVKMLLQQGFIRIQESVFIKLSINKSVAEATINNVKKNLPPYGSVICLDITERQFSDMKFLIGSIKTDIIMSDEKVIYL